MANEKPQLVGLNDNLGAINPNLISNISSCLKKISPADAVTHIKSMNGSNFEKFGKHVMGALCGWSSPANFEIKDHKLESESPFYQKFKLGGTFTDDYGNRIYIHLSTAGLTNTLKLNGFYGKNPIQIAQINNDSRGDGNGWNLSSTFNSCNLDIAGKKYSENILIYINQGDISDFSKYWDSILLTALAIALQAIPGLGQAAIALISSAAKIGINYAKNGNLPTLSDAIGFAKGAYVSCGGDANSEIGNIANYAQDGATVYDAINKKDYATIAQKLGISQNQTKLLTNNQQSGKPIIENYIENNDTMAIAYNSNLTIQEINAKLSNIRNQYTLENTSKAVQVADGKDSLTSSEILNGVMQYGTTTEDASLRNIYTKAASGLFPSVFPTSAGANDYWNWIKDNAGKEFNTPLMQDTILKMQMNMPVSSGAFDDLLLFSLEKQLEKGGITEFVLPAELPAAKAQCFAKELATSGIKVILSKGQAERTEVTSGLNTTNSIVSNMDKTSVSYSKNRKFFN